MAVYREGYKILEEITKKLVRIYDDAADVGVPVKKDDEIWNCAKQMANSYAVEGTREEYSKSKDGYVGVIIEIELIDEWGVSDEVKSLKEAIERYQLEYYACTKGKCKGFDGFVNIYRK